MRKLINKKYITYGLSIVFSRGLELMVLFIAAKILLKTEYGELEYYKKVIELGGAFVSFGFPTLIMTYTKSRQSKVHLLLFAFLFSSVLLVVLSPVLLYFGAFFVVIPILFYSMFFHGGIIQSYILVNYNSYKTSIYKILVSLLFYTGVLLTVLWLYKGRYAYVLPSYALFPLFFLFILHEYRSEHIRMEMFKKYIRHFLKLLGASLSLVINNFSNIMFLYTDIFLIKYLSGNPNVEIADYSFSLNVANVLILIPLTLVQVDIEKLKTTPEYFKTLNHKIIVLTLIAAGFLTVFYLVLTGKVFVKYQNTYILFLVLLLAKVFQAFSPANGTALLIRQKYNLTMWINLTMILINVVFSFMLYPVLGLYGIAAMSLICLVLRFIALSYFRKKYF